MQQYAVHSLTELQQNITNELLNSGIKISKYAHVSLISCHQICQNAYQVPTCLLLCIQRSDFNVAVNK